MLTSNTEPFFRHTDGGIYQLAGFGKDSRDASPVVIYRHIWPFEGETWVRPAAEWLSRFRLMNEADVEVALAGDRAQAQATVTAAKAARKGAAISAQEKA